MASKVYDYPGEKISVHYDVKRCIHAAECSRGLPAVFDSQRKPWVDPNAAPADAVAEVVMRCPTGALHFTRHDNAAPEPVPETNTISVFPNGPLVLKGDLEVQSPDGRVVLKDTRVALCRCGASKNKPFCDGSHTKAEFQDTGELGKNTAKTVATEASEQTVKVIPSPNGPFTLKGEVELLSADGQVRHTGNRMFLCRCGASGNKPFCDGTHAKTGFTAE
jgi:CDGSH-type Zn-finger protein/uncharacterized Fe-S cluster protein YjdI